LCFYGCEIHNLLNFLDLPSLQTISLIQLDWDGDVLQALWRLFQRSGNLENITLLKDPEADEIDYDGVTSPNFDAIPITLRSVTRFAIQGNHVASLLLRKLSFPYLQELNIGGTPFDIIHNYLSLSTELREISLSDITDFPETHPPTLLLPFVMTLSIQSSSEILDSFIGTPRLESLTLDNCYRTPIQDPGISLWNFIGRLEPALHTLVLDGVDISDDEVIWCLRSLPGLKDLTLRHCALSDVVLHALAVPTGTPISPGWEQCIIGSTRWLLPELTKVYIIRNTRMTPHGAIEFLTSRNGTGPSTSPSEPLPPPPRVEGEISFYSIERSDYETIQSYGVTATSLLLK